MLLSIKTWIVCLIPLPFLLLFFGFHSPPLSYEPCFSSFELNIMSYLLPPTPPDTKWKQFHTARKAFKRSCHIICTVTFSCHVFFLSFLTPAFFSGLFLHFFPPFLPDIHSARSAVSCTDTDRELVGPDAHFVHVSRVPRVLGAIYW